MPLSGRSPLTLPDAAGALPGRTTPMAVAGRHFVSGRGLKPPYPAGTDLATVGMGCFWGAERRFWKLEGVWVTAVGYAGGFTPNPTYEEVCSGGTGHAEVVRIVFDPVVLPYRELLRAFWEGHNPTQGMRQGNDVGTQYRSAIYTHSPEQAEVAQSTRDGYGAALAVSGYGTIKTEIAAAGPFYFAEDYHQQYLAKNPGGYCGLGGTGVCLGPA